MGSGVSRCGEVLVGSVVSYVVVCVLVFCVGLMNRIL